MLRRPIPKNLLPIYPIHSQGFVRPGSRVEDICLTCRAVRRNQEPCGRRAVICHRFYFGFFLQSCNWRRTIWKLANRRYCFIYVFHILHGWEWCVGFVDYILVFCVWTINNIMKWEPSELSALFCSQPQLLQSGSNARPSSVVSHLYKIYTFYLFQLLDLWPCNETSSKGFSWLNQP